MDAFSVLHGTVADQVAQEMKYLAAKLSTAQEARAQGKIETEKIDESSHPHGPSEDHRIARTSNLRPDTRAMERVILPWACSCSGHARGTGRGDQRI